MVNQKTGQRELVYVVRVDEIRPIEGKDRVECAVVGGWTIMVRKGIFKPGSLGVYFEIDSLVPQTQTFAFLADKHYKIKTQKYGKFYSQGLLMSAEELKWTDYVDGVGIEHLYDPAADKTYEEGDFLTEALGVTYYSADDRQRKSNVDKYKLMAQRMGKKASKQPYRWLLKRDWGKKLLYIFFGKKKVDGAKQWPTGKFQGVSKTDQERVENMIWALEDKTPFIVTQKCDGSSGTYILERKPFGKYEFYVCSRNVRMASEKQESFYGEHNYYWEVAKKYDIENKMRKWLKENPKASFVCWQGEICAPAIQGNPHKLTKTHFYCFHWTDSINGRRDIRDAAEDWESMGMEVVPIVDFDYVLPDDFEEFKKSAEGFYDPSVCEGQKNCPREGYVYYKTTDPTFSFKNVSRPYIMKHQ